MTFIKQILPVLLLLLFIIAGCEENHKPVEEAQVIPKFIEPEGTGLTGGDSGTAGDSPVIKEKNSVVPAIAIDEDFTVVQTININLDLDPIEEQIISVTRGDTPESTISVLVADFDTVRNEYRNTWEVDTNSINSRSFSIRFEDIVGDHNLEILCFGIDPEGNQTLNVYRKTHAPDGLGLYYSPICTITANGSVEIQTQERTQAYKLRQKNGISFPIVAYSHDPESENIMDLVKSTYYWKYQSNEYEIGKEEKVPGRKVEERQLQELFIGTSRTFEQFLYGPWFKTSSENGSGTISGMDIITFDNSGRRITLFSGNIQEIYIWEASHRTRLPNSVYINSRNELIPYLTKQFSVYIDALDTIHVRIKDDEFKKSDNPWDGQYKQLSPELQKSFSQNIDEFPEALSPSDLSGHYKNDLGMELIFEFPRFTLQEEKSAINGGYSLYSLQYDQILELIIQDKAGLVTDTRSYRIDYSKQVGDNTVIHVCRLQPGVVTVYGFLESQEEALRFEQIEIIEKEDN